MADSGKEAVMSRIGLLEKRVRKLEELICENTEEKRVEPTAAAVPRQTMQEKGKTAIPQQRAASGIRPLSEKELTACMALKELRQPSSIEEINRHLAKTRFIKETAKETLMIRLRGAIEKGVIALDPASKKFSLNTLTFVVE